MKENRQWNDWKADNSRHLDLRDARRQAGRELANKALAEEDEIMEDNQQVEKSRTSSDKAFQRAADRRITLEKPIYKAREHIKGYRRRQGNYYGLTTAEARLFGKDHSSKSIL